MNYNEIVKRYPTSFKKANVTASTLAQLDHCYIITERVTTYVDGKKLNVTEKEISADYFANCVSAIEWFKDRVTKSYTSAGYIVTQLSATSPDKSTRIVRGYTYNYIGYGCR